MSAFLEMNSDSFHDVRLRARFRSETRRAILEAAEQVLSAEGAHAARVEDIAHAAGVAVGTVYNYFTDRQTLLHELFRATREELIVRIDAALEEKSAPFEQQVRGFFRAAFDHCDRHRGVVRLLFEEELAVQKAEGRRSAMRELSLRASELVQRGVRAGILRAEDAGVYPAALLGMIRGNLAQAIYQSNPEPLVTRVDPLTRLFLRGAGEGAAGGGP